MRQEMGLAIINLLRFDSIRSSHTSSHTMQVASFLGSSLPSPRPLNGFDIDSFGASRNAVGRDGGCMACLNTFLSLLLLLLSPIMLFKGPFTRN